MSNSDRGSLLFVLFATCVTALGGFLFGYDTAVINGANSLIKEHWGLQPYEEGLVGASAILGCIPGAMFAGLLSDRFGRKRMLFLCALLYGLSAVLFLPALTPNLYPFLIARFICGLGIGASSMICPVYIAELAPEKWRGRLGTLFQLAIVVGIFLTLFVNKTVQEHGNEACNSFLALFGQRPSEIGNAAWNTAVGWRWMLGIGALPAVLFFVLLLGVPESPRWLTQNNRETEAREILCRAAGAVHAGEQMAEIREAIGQEEGRFSELFGGVYFRPVVLAVVLMLCSQFCGINAIIYYSTKIFEAAGADKTAAFAATAWMGVVNLVATLVAVACVDKLGRRPLLLLGTAVQTLALGMIGWMFFANTSGAAVPAGPRQGLSSHWLDGRSAAGGPFRLYHHLHRSLCRVAWSDRLALLLGGVSQPCPRSRHVGRRHECLDLLLHRRPDLSHAERQSQHRTSQDLLDLWGRKPVRLRLRGGYSSRKRRGGRWNKSNATGKAAKLGKASRALEFPYVAYPSRCRGLESDAVGLAWQPDEHPRRHRGRKR